MQFHVVKEFHELFILLEKREDLKQTQHSHESIEARHSGEAYQSITLVLRAILYRYNIRLAIEQLKRNAGSDIKGEPRYNVLMSNSFESSFDKSSILIHIS